MEISFDNLTNKEILKDISNILFDFDIISSKRIKSDKTHNLNSKEFLNDFIEKKCRFCEKSYPDVTFQNETHAIPNFMGNDLLFTKFECDSCNKYFRDFESEFANFLLPYNTIAGVKGKKKLPKYKLKGQPIIESTSKNSLLITELPNLNINEKNNVEFKVKRPSYIPDYVYRCLIKIALTILPEKKIHEYRDVTKWLMNKNYNSIVEQQMIFSIYPFDRKMDEITCILMEKKTTCNKDFIDTILFISYSNFGFQTYLPHSNTEIKKSKSLKPFPYLIPTILDFDKANRRDNSIINLDSKVKFANEDLIFDIINVDSVEK